MHLYNYLSFQIEQPITAIKNKKKKTSDSNVKETEEERVNSVQAGARIDSWRVHRVHMTGERSDFLS